MRSYPLYIAGMDVETGKWAYVVRASAYIDDKRRAFKKKRHLELGKETEIDDDVVGRCAMGTEEHQREAIAAAVEAGRDYRRNFSLVERVQIIRDINERLLLLAPELIDILVAEGHPKKLAQWEVSGMLRACDDATLDWYQAQLSQEFTDGDKSLKLVRKPDGVVCVSPPQNASGSNSGLGILALLAGNSLIVRAPRTAPLSVMFAYREIVAPVLDRHGVPAGTLNLVGGVAASILDTWIDSPDVATILYFGDSTIGLRIEQRCAAAGKKAILELSGNDGFVVWKDADLNAAARALEESFYGSGQICMVPKYAIVHPDVAEQFLTIFLSRVEKIRPGYPEDPDVLLSPVLKVDKFMDYLSEAKQAGAEVLTGGERVDVDGRSSPTGMFLQPTVVRVAGFDSADTLSCVREETFFPLLPIVVPDLAADDVLVDEVIDFMDANKYGLRNSVWSSSEEVLDQFAATLNNGGLLKFNDSHIGFVSPLAGHGGTGWTGGPNGELNFVGLRTTHLQGIVYGDSNPSPLDPVVAP